MEEKSNEKKQQTVMYKGLSVRSEEVQEVMGGGGSPPDPAEGNDDAGVRCWSRAVSASSTPRTDLSGNIVHSCPSLCLQPLVIRKFISDSKNTKLVLEIQKRL